MAYIIVSNDERELERRELRRPLVLGRSSRCDITIDDKLVSRNHCRLAPLDDTWMIEDLGSHNGTCVNGVEVKRHLLAEGDRIEIGQTLIEFHLGPMPSHRPSNPHEARLHAELLREVDAKNSDETITASRPLPQAKVTPPKVRAPTDRDVMHGSPVAFRRPMPAPKIAAPEPPAGTKNPGTESEPSKPARAPAAEPQSLFARLLGRKRS